MSRTLKKIVLKVTDNTGVCITLCRWERGEQHSGYLRICAAHGCGSQSVKWSLLELHQCIAMWSREMDHLLRISVLRYSQFLHLISFVICHFQMQKIPHIFETASPNLTRVFNKLGSSYALQMTGQYFEILFLAEFHLSCKMQLLIYECKKKNSKIPSEN